MTTFIVKKEESDMQALYSIMQEFNMASRLKINWSKFEA